MSAGTYTGKKVATLILAALIGGAAGYFGSTLIIEGLMKKREDEEKGDVVLFVPPLKVVKPEIAELAAKYKSDPTMTIIMDEEGWLTETAEKQTIMYYADGVYAYENGDRVEHPATLVGANAHLHFGEDSGDPDVVYIWNARMKVAYEVIRQKETYAKEVLGIAEKPKKVKAKPKSPNKLDLQNEEDNV